LSAKIIGIPVLAGLTMLAAKWIIHGKIRAAIEAEARDMIPDRRIISWTGGLWRIWIVLSCLWVVVAYFITDPIGKIQHRNDPILIYIGADTAEFPSNTDLKVMRTALVELVKKENDALKSPIMNLLGNIICLCATPKRKQRRHFKTTLRAIR
jgi:hypothetical protein